jgi:acetyl-CoA carboxylase biotin carboxylase subunit
MKLFNKILIANRGEIAVRIQKTAKELGIKTVALYCEIEKEALFVQQADESYSLGNGDLNSTYLNISTIIQIARQSGCDAIHPGYGFLSENPKFAEACEKANIAFIGPTAASMRLMGNKITARNFVKKWGIPVTQGITGDLEELKKAGNIIPFPLLIKAAAGGGGKGMRIVRNQTELEEALESTRREALSYFGDDSVYVEQYIQNPRHIEIQILGDHHGNVVHLFERECSIQRRYQKIIEESPSPTLTETVREQMAKTAVEIAKKMNYVNAGTLEFLLDENMNFYFLEMNTRVQVEHPVTEMVTGIDIVKEQITIAAGNALTFKQNDIKQTGHAIECRIYAENPEIKFIPSPGAITLYKQPVGEAVRIDSSINKPADIESSFDPMISKLIVWGNDRKHAIEQSILALENYVIQGITTNISFLQSILHDENFAKNRISTHYIATNLSDLLASIKKEKESLPVEIPLSAFLIANFIPKTKSNSIWNAIGYWRELMHLTIILDNREYRVNVIKNTHQVIEFELNAVLFKIENWKYNEAKINFLLNNTPHLVYVSFDTKGKTHITYKGISFLVNRTDQLVKEDVFSGFTELKSDDVNHIFSPMPGKIIKIDVNVGDTVVKGDNLLIVEAMKMENQIKAPRNAVIQKLNIKVNDTVNSNSPLIVFEN